MHSTRIMALVGAVIGIIGLFMKALSTAGAEYLPKIAEGARAMGSDKEIPESIPTIWQGLDSFEKPMVVIAIVITVVLAVIGARKAIMNMASSIVVLVLGVGLFIYALLKWLDTADKADQLAEVFQTVKDLGFLPEAYSVSTGVVGFSMLLIGTGLVAIVGVLGLIPSKKA